LAPTAAADRVARAAAPDSRIDRLGRWSRFEHEIYLLIAALRRWQSFQPATE